MLEPGLVLCALIVGLCIGSFLNVVVYRLPLGRSVNDPPRSACPACGEPIRAWDNLPVVSYLWLRARCRQCHGPIHWRYPLVELSGGLLAAGCVVRFGPTPQALMGFGLCAVLLAAALIDLDHRIIPDRLTLGATPIFWAASAALTEATWRDGMAGLIVGAGSLWLVAAGYQRLTGREGMGMGDVKLMGLIGAALGWPGAVLTIFAGAFYGLLGGAAAMARGRRGMKTAIPFGPFLALGALTHLMAGPELVAAYLRLMH
jgi:leader peptidase (prepilin peptidase)/N-methyltransferase